MTANRIVWSLLVVVVSIAVGQMAVRGQGPSAEMQVVNRAADALGGKDRLMAVKTLRIEGYGQLLTQAGGGNISASPDAPQKFADVTGLVKTIDLANGRMRVQQRQANHFVFAYERNMRGVDSVQGLDGDVAFNVNADGRAVRVGAAAARARRIDMLANPIALIRAALDPAAKVTNLQTAGDVQTVDLATAKGDRVTFAVTRATNLPAWVRWVEPDTNLGDLTVRMNFTGYQAEGGLLLPSGYNASIDFRNLVQQRWYVERTTIDVQAGDLAAPEAVRAAAAPVPQAPAIEVIPVGKGIWYLRGQGHSTAFEFADHITLYEAYGSEANALAIIAKARTLVPGKPVTEVIVSHHHFDHTGGLRAAVAEGLTVITQRNNVAIVQEMAARPARLFPDALGRSPKPVRVRPVDEELVLKDAMMEVRVLRVVSNSHMADAVIAYAPSERTVSQGDLVDENWDLVWWGNSYPDTVKKWNLQVDRDLAVHGKINTWADSLQHLRRQAKNAAAFCDVMKSANVSMPGCPATNVGF